MLEMLPKLVGILPDNGVCIQLVGTGVKGPMHYFKCWLILYVDAEYEWEIVTFSDVCP